MRKQIKKRFMIYRVISKIINTNILNEFSEEQFKKSRNESISSIDETSESEESSSFRFENMTMSSQKDIHSLYKSVIYDSKCSDLLIYDRDRFVNEIKSADK